MAVCFIVLNLLGCSSVKADSGVLSTTKAADSAFTFEEALLHGAVYLAPSHSQGETKDLISLLGELQPGIVADFAYFWGGPTPAKLDSAALIVSEIRRTLHKTLLVGALSEGVRPDYDETLRCGGKMGSRHFSAETITAHRRQTTTSIWVDLSKPDAASFYMCVATRYIDDGFDVIRFEAPVLVLRNSVDPAVAAKAYEKIRAGLLSYSEENNRKIYFLGDPELTKYIPLDGVFVPSRFYHTHLESALKYQNKIERPGIGVGYAYSLSPLIVRDTVAAVPPGVKVMFAVDSWDPTQDDLRRFMELDEKNRRFLIRASAETARRGGAVFVVPVDGCPGCTPPAAVVDRCELLKDGSTEYNASRCEDAEDIKSALHTAARAQPAPLYSLDEALAKGTVSPRMSLFNDTDQRHVLESIDKLDPGISYATYVGVWGVIRQQDIEAAGRLASKLRQQLPRTILGGGVNESVALSMPPQTLHCGGEMGSRTFAPNAMVDLSQRALGDTAWLDLAKPEARDYYLCIGLALIDKGYTLIGFPEHENLIAHSSSKPNAIRNLVGVFKELRRYGNGKGQNIYISGDPATDDTAAEVDFYYVPSRFYHTTFAQRYQNKILRPGVGVGYTYSLSPQRVQDVMATVPSGRHVFFYVDNWDSKQDDLRRFMELDGANRRDLLQTSAQTARRGGAQFIFNLLHCVDCIPAGVVGDPCEIRSDGKTEYDAVACGDMPTIMDAMRASKMAISAGSELRGSNPRLRQSENN
jgi:hypothetical protein